MTIKNIQRRFRSREERDAIRDETHEALANVGLHRTSHMIGISTIYQLLDEFVVAEGSGRQIDGSINLPDIGARIEYMLPGKRIVRHFVRLVSADKEHLDHL